MKKILKAITGNEIKKLFLHIKMSPLRMKGYKITWYLWLSNREGPLWCHKTIYIHKKKTPISNTLYAFNDFQINNKDLDFEKLQV